MSKAPSPFLAAYRRAAALGRTLDPARRLELQQALTAMCLAHVAAPDDVTDASRPETGRLRRRIALHNDQLPMAWRGLPPQDDTP